MRVKRQGRSISIILLKRFSGRHCLNDEPDGLFPAICFDGDADQVAFCDRGFLGFNEMAAFIARLIAKD